MTGRDLITASLRLIGVLASGEALQASEAADGLSALNRMIDTWSTQNLLIPNKVREVFALVGSQQTYTMGTGGNFSTPRPQKIENALIQLTSNSPVLELPMDILTKDQFAAIMLKGTTSTFPLYVYPDNAFPLISLSVWPIPTQINNIVLYSWKPLATLAALTTATSLPPGFEDALIYNLAIRIAPEYGRAPSEIIIGIAAEGKAEIKRMNSTPQYLRVDPELMAKPAVWNYRTGDT